VPLLLNRAPIGFPTKINIQKKNENAKRIEIYFNSKNTEKTPF